MAETDPRPLIEDVDYTVEDGRWVFTAAYLLRRGRCCGSGCRNCPYGDGGTGEGPAGETPVPRSANIRPDPSGTAPAAPFATRPRSSP